MITFPIWSWSSESYCDSSWVYHYFAFFFWDNVNKSKKKSAVVLIGNQIMIKVTPQFILEPLLSRSLSAFNHEFYLTLRFLLNTVFHHRSHSGNCIIPGKDSSHFFSSNDSSQRQHSFKDKSRWQRFKYLNWT